VFCRLSARIPGNEPDSHTCMKVGNDAHHWRQVRFFLRFPCFMEGLDGFFFRAPGRGPAPGAPTLALGLPLIEKPVTDPPGLRSLAQGG